MEDFSSYAKHHKFIMGILAVIVILATAVGARLNGKNKQTELQNQTVKVSLVSAKDYMKSRGIVSANGTVESLEQAELRSQFSAPVSKIYTQIGKQVSAGQVLVTLQNSDISAQLAQTQALLKAAQARLDEMKKGLRTEELDLLETQMNAAKQALADTKAQQDTAVASALSNLLNAGLSAMPSSGNTGSSNPAISGSYTGTERGQYKISLYATGSGIRFQASGLESAEGEVSATPIKMGSKGLYIQFPSTNMPTNNTWTVDIPNTQAAGYTALNSAYQSTLQGRETAVNAATNALSAAQKQYDLKLAGASNEQIKAQEAAVEQAEANVKTVAAQLEKTVIRSPIKGTVSVLSVKYGELVSPGQLVASVVNKGGLQVKAYISDYDLPYVAEGAEVKINDTATGTVARMATSVDPRTKNVEVQVVVSDPENSGLVAGQNASIKISAKENSDGGMLFLLPLQAVKVSSSGASVFTVNDDNTVTERQVTLGSVSGEFVEIKSGMDPEMKIVPAVSELKDGQKVNVQ